MKSLKEIKEDFTDLELPIGVMIAEATPEIPAIFANNMFAQMLGYDSPKEFLKVCGSAWNCICKEDIKRLKAASATRSGKFEPYKISYRAIKKDGSLIWVSQNSRHTLDENGREIIFAYYNDITEQVQAENALRESEFRYATAIKASNINIWEYNYADDTMTIFSKSPQINPDNLIIKNYSTDVIEQKHIRDDSAPLLFEMIDKLKKGATEVGADLWVRNSADGDFWCERVNYTNIFDAQGKPVRAYCVGHDVTKEKEAEKRYRDELSYREAMQKATVASVNVNLTQNVIMDYKSIFPEILERMNTSKTAQEYFDTVYTQLTTKELQEKCAAVFNRDALLRSFSSGETTIAMELMRKIEGRRYSTVLTAHMMKKVGTNEIVAFLYSTDITAERTMQNVMNAIVKTDYDFLVVVDGVRNTAIRYSQNDLGNRYAQESDDFEQNTREYICKYICKNDVARVANEISIKNILLELDSYGTYSVFYAVPDKDGKSLKKQLRFNYINKELKIFLMTRIDITVAVEEQEKKNRELVTAVKMAQSANAAKSEFLSRISHEIRTPMNAIIGMSEIALQSIDDKKVAQESIEKSIYASQYLLLLLNDILDMSKIETGKVTLKNEVIGCDKLLAAINTIIGTQAKAKGVEYVVTEFEGRKDSYLGDGVRLQQILINILSNAVKFTPTGGRVSLDTTQLSREDKKVNICFKISDTGIGIGKGFLPKIFNPFSQEHIGSTTKYGGSGLGLAISKNLANLMGGDIFVESKLGEGTTFRVNIPLGLTDSCIQEPNANAKKECSGEYDFTGKKILLVEDHQLNIMVATKLLEFKNASVDVAENGQIGLDKFIAANGAYDAVLMDIRMPVMDGLESAQRIRTLAGAWAKSVPIIAMSANAFEEDVRKSKAAGMNAHLAKPIDSDLLYHTLCKLFSKKGAN